MLFNFIPEDIIKNLDSLTLEVLKNSEDEQQAINELLKIIVSFNCLKSREEIIFKYNFSKRSFDDLVRANKIPHYKINNCVYRRTWTPKSETLGHFS